MGEYDIKFRNQTCISVIMVFGTGDLEIPGRVLHSQVLVDLTVIQFGNVYYEIRVDESRYSHYRHLGFILELNARLRIEDSYLAFCS